MGLLAVTVLVYAVGLNGPFLLDDPPNLILPINAWLRGETGWQEVLLGNRSGLLGRPLSMLSFIANAASSGMKPLPFKATNLAIHVACGLLIYALLVRLLKRDAQLSAKATLIALLISAVWLLHPIQVSTVLYIVQRMAQLSALFILLGLLAYVHGRQVIEQGRLRAGMAWLFLAVPSATTMAMLCKENGALVPALCAVIELGYFRTRAQAPRTQSVNVFFILFLAAPATLITCFYALHPERLLAGYDERLFTLSERLMSQPRALFDYIGALLLPRGPMLGIYTDDFAASRSLLTPPATLFAIIGLAALIVGAVLVRTRMPAFFTGIGLFLVGHAMESTVFPLELYFEHRNYLPSVGVFLALASVVGSAVAKLLQGERADRAKRLLTVGAVAILAMLALATFARASVWRYWPSLAEQGAREHPNSMRAQLDHASMLMAGKQYTEARKVVEHLERIDNPAAHHVAVIEMVFLQCLEHAEATPDSIARISRIAGDKLQLSEMLTFKKLAEYLHKHECRNLSKAHLATLIRDIVDAAPQPQTLTAIWRSRFTAAELYMHDGQPVEAQQQAALAWMSGTADTAVGVYLARLYYFIGDRESARLVLGDVSKRVATWDRRNLVQISDLQQKLDNESLAPSPLPSETAPSPAAETPR
ncbi:MAG: hypothetical protein GXC76_03610 [Rhodanobacteraceae bacterium]|nr:hypothetical protein [Rhodanobacteraceae bacterium]